MQKRSNSFIGAVLAGLMLIGLAASASAIDPSGTYTWTMQGRPNANANTNAPARVMTLKLKLDGEKLTGTVTAPGRQGAPGADVAIEEAKIKGDEVSFTVTREFNGNKMVQKYSGKATAEAIKGKVESERNGQPVSRDWEAKKEVKK
jgi:hypothetical protein